MIRVLLADSHRLLHPSIHAIFAATNDLMLTGEVTNGHELRQICQEHHPDLILFSPCHFTPSMWTVHPAQIRLMT